MKTLSAFFLAFIVLFAFSPVFVHGSDDDNQRPLLERVKLATSSEQEDEESDDVEPRKIELFRNREQENENEDEREQEMEERKEELRIKLQKIKNEQKQKVVEKLDERLSMINENWTEHWNNVLKRLNMILDKIESRATKLGEQGKNISVLTQQINYAQAAIDTAQAAVDAQAEKDYSFEITDETNLREDVKATIAEFKADAKAVLASIKSARENVRLALVQVGQLTGEKVEVEEETE